MQLEQDSKSYYTDFLTMRKDVRFFGKSLEEWVQTLTPRLPDEMTYDDVRVYSLKLDEAYTIAHNNYALACGIHSFRKREQEKQSIKSYSTIKDKMTVVAQERFVMESTEEIRDMVIFSEMVELFWAQQLKLLERRNKLIEGIFWSIKQSDK